MIDCLIITIIFLCGIQCGRKECEMKARKYIETQFLDCDSRQAAIQLFSLIGGKKKENRRL